MIMQTIIGKQFSDKVTPLINSAKKSIDIIVYDWRWYAQDPGASVQLFNQAIVRAVRRGVRVRAIANSNDIISVLRDVGIDAKKLITEKLVHIKLMIIDDEVVVLGSHNYTQSAFNLNMELSVILNPPENIDEISSFFNRVWGI
jgi:phosphatidylserine/phosphatidylglycerophosphate/cardiolipin synthase-like enzyme